METAIKKESNLLDNCFKDKQHINYSIFNVDIGDELFIHTIKACPTDINNLKSNTPILLIHGYLGSGASARHLIAKIAETNIVYAIDLLGWWLSSRPDYILEDKE